MSLRVLTAYGAIASAVPYMGTDKGEVFLDALTPEEALQRLPEIISDFDARLLRLEEGEES